MRGKELHLRSLAYEASELASTPPRMIITYDMATSFGFEPKLADSETAVLPLNDEVMVLVMGIEPHSSRRKAERASIYTIRSYVGEGDGFEPPNDPVFPLS